jgi:hypothetical protein
VIGKHKVDRCDEKEKEMRKFLLVGTAGLAFVFGAVGANAQSVRERPESSPYALQASDLGSLKAPGFGALLTEGRSAFVGETAGSGYQNNGNGSIKNAAPISQQFDTFRAR